MKFIDENKAAISFGDIKLSLISLFELQAKATKLSININLIIEGINVIKNAFEVIPFYEPDIIKIAHELRKYLTDYIDCIIIATAITNDKELATEDRDIHAIKSRLKKKYRVKIYSFNDLISESDK